MKRSLFLFLFAIIASLSLDIEKAFSQVYFTEGFEGDTTGKFKNSILPPVANPPGGVEKWRKITKYKKFGGGAVRFDTTSPRGGTSLGAFQDMALEMKNSIDLSTSGFPLLTFWHMCILENPTAYWDKAYVQISVDDGANWTSLPVDSYLGSGNYFPETTTQPRSVSPAGPWFTTNSYQQWVDSITSNTAAPTSPSGLWKKEVFSLSNFKASQVKVRYYISTDDNTIWWGWALDSVSIAEPQGNDIKAFTIDEPLPNSVFIQNIQQISPKGTIRNVGGNPLSNITTKFKIYNTVFSNIDSAYHMNSVIYVDSGVVAGPLAPGASSQLSFTPITLSTAGVYFAVELCTSTNDVDNTNDSIAQKFVIGSTIQGEYTIGKAPSDFTSIPAAMDFLATSAVIGNITFLLKDTLYSLPNKPMHFQISYFPPESTFTAVLKPASGVNSRILYTGTADNPNALWIPNSKNVIIDGSNNGTNSQNLTIEANDYSGVTVTPIRIENSSNVTVKNVKIIGYRNQATGTGSGVVVTSNGTSVNRNITLDNLRITKAFQGIFSSGNSSSLRDVNITIKNCFIGQVGSYDVYRNGILLNNIDSAYVYNNEINGLHQNEGFGGGEMHGITATVRYSRIYNNIVHDVENRRQAGFNDRSAVHGIRVNGRTAGFESKNVIYNNIVYGLSHLSTVNSQKRFGIRVSRGSNDTIAYNTVYLSGRTLLIDTTAAFVLDTTKSVVVLNNIFYNGMQDSTLGLDFAVWRRPDTTVSNSSIAEMNNNVLYAPTPTGYIGGRGYSTAARMRTFKTFVDWQGSQTPNLDTNSVAGDPNFIHKTSPENFHIIDTVKSWAEGRGKPISSVVDDIDGNLRDFVSPDAGADEFNGIGYPHFDMEASGIDNPHSGGTKLVNSPFRPVVTFHNTGAKSLKNVPVRFLYRAPGSPDFLNLYQGDTVLSTFGVNEYKTIVFNNILLPDTGDYTAKAEVDLGTDENPDNNLILIPFKVGFPLAGVKTVGQSGRYATLNDAIIDLKSAGMGSPVEIQLISSSYNEPPILIDTAIAGLSASNPLTIRPATGVTATIQFASTPNDPYGIRINKVSGVTIDGSNTPGGTSRDLTLIATGGSGQYGVLITGGGYGTGGSAVTKPATRNTVQNVNVQNGATNNYDVTRFYGVYMLGRIDISNAPKDSFNTVRNCDISNFGQAGIVVRYNVSPLIEKNDIHDWTQTFSGVNIVGIWDSANVPSAVIRGNKIYNLTHQVNGGVVEGINISVGAGSNAQVYNNMIYGIGSYGAGGTSNVTRGIVSSNLGNTNDQFYYNSVFLNGSDSSASQSTGNRAVGFEYVGTNGQVRNNIFVSSMHHVRGYNYAIFLGLSTNFSSDYNDLYSTEDSSFVGYNSSVIPNNRKSLVDWQNSFASPQDTNSVSADPMFISNSNLHIQPSPVRSVAESWGIPAGGISTDIDGDARNVSTPDIGADEFNGSPAIQKNLSANSISDPVLGRLKRGGVPFIPIGKISNNGSKKQYGVPVRMRFKNTQTNYEVVASMNVNIPSYSSMTVSFPLTAIDSAGTYTAELTSELPGDADNSNDTTRMQFKVLLGLHGVLSVPGSYSSIPGLLDTLAQVGVDQPLVVKFTSPINETSPIMIDSIQGASSVNTIRFTSGINGRASVSAAGIPSYPAAIVLRGASYVTLDSLEISATGNDGNIGVMIGGVSGKTASSNTIKNCVISNAASPGLSSIGYYGIYLKGLSALKDQGNSISYNDISTFGQAAIRSDNNNNLTVEYNKIHDWTQQLGQTDLVAIWLSSGTTNATVRHNIIANIVSQAPGTSAVGIEQDGGVANTNLLCYNNLLYGISSVGAGTNSNRVRGILSTNANHSGDRYYYNTLNLTGNNLSNSQVSYAAGLDAVTGNSTGIIFKNNIIYNSITHGNISGRSYAVRFSGSNPSAGVVLNNNLYYTPNSSETAPQGYIGRYVSSDKFTISDWRTASNQDAQTKNSDPRFLSGTDLHISTVLPRSEADGNGVAISEVTTDIDGETRLNPPDIGADEFSVVSRISGKILEDGDGLTSTTNDRAALSGWKVFLKKGGNTLTTVTNAQGVFSFSNLTDGIYTLTDSLNDSTFVPLDVVLGTNADGTQRLDSASVSVTVGDGDDAVNFNLLSYRPSTIKVNVYDDGDGNFGTTNDRELKNWNVKIYRISQNPVTLVDNSDSSEVKDKTLGAGTYVIVQADTSSPSWIHLGKQRNGSTPIAGTFSTDTVVLGPASSHSVKFTNFLPHAISVRVEEDADGSFSFTQTDTVAKEWGVRLVAITGTALDTNNYSVNSTGDSNLVHTYLHRGKYLISQTDSTSDSTRLWSHLGIIRNGVRQRKIGINFDTVEVNNGESLSIIFVNTRIYPDTVKYRTFQGIPTEMGIGKGEKLKRPKKAGDPYPIPNIANVVNTAYDKSYPKGTKLVVGIARTDSNKKYLWMEIGKSKEIAKVFGGIHTGTPEPMTIPKYGKKGPIKAAFKEGKVDNKLLAQLVALRINISISDNGVVADLNDPIDYKFGDLLYMGPDTLYKGKSLRAIANLADTMLTQYNLYSDLTWYTRIHDVIKAANDAFYDPRPLSVADTLETGPGGVSSYGGECKTCVYIQATITVDEANPGYFIRDVHPPDRMHNAPFVRMIPETYGLEQNYPNPFNPATTIEFYTPEDAYLTLKIYNVLGQEVKTLLNHEYYDAGYDEIHFDASNLSSGVYFYRFHAVATEGAGEFSAMKKMILIK